MVSYTNIKNGGIAMKQEHKATVKAMRAAARETVPMSSIRSRTIPMKRKSILAKIAKREARGE